MDILGKAATAFNRLSGIKYEIVLGKKGKTTTFTISFEKHEFYHVAGLQYLKDIRELHTACKKGRRCVQKRTTGVQKGTA